MPATDDDVMIINNDDNTASTATETTKNDNKTMINNQAYTISIKIRYSMKKATE